MKAGILCFGTATVDLGKTIDRYPLREHVATISEVTKSTGGPGLNIAVDLRNLDMDLDIHFIGAIGDDTNGNFLMDECARYRIDTSGVQIHKGTLSTFTDCMVEKHGGKRTFFVYPGSGNLLDGDLVNFSKYDVSVFHLGAPGLHELMDQTNYGENGWSRLLKRAQKFGAHTNMEMVSIEPTRLKELVIPCLPYLDSVIINEVEAGVLTEIQYEKTDDKSPLNWEKMEFMALKLIELGVKKFAAIHTPLGVVAADAQGNVYRQGSVNLPEDQIVSATGAGDAVAAGIIYGVLHGWNISESIRAGVCAAAMCILKEHTSDGILPIEETLHAAEGFGFRTER